MGKSKSSCNVVYFCDGKKCCRYNDEAKSCFKSLISESGLEDKIVFERMKCQGMCKKAPIFYIESEKEFKKEVTEKKAKKIFEKYIVV